MHTFSYQKEGSRYSALLRQFCLHSDSAKQEQFAIEGFYKFNYNEKDKVFELRTRKYFFDYNNEPSIEVKVEFERNDDYFLIANNSFGITFGSENRLFLAGHKDYPNVERYNVSKDLLGGNDKSQSYETTYFPSKNYRIVGGKERDKWLCYRDGYSLICYKSRASRRSKTFYSRAAFR